MIEIRGDREVRQMLGQYKNPTLTKRLQDATKAGATVFKPAVKAEAGRVSKRLARSVSVRRAKRDRPATILVFRPKVAFFRHFVIGGTRDHGPRKAQWLFFIPGWNQYFTTGPPAGRSQVRAKRVRGVRANPIIARVASRLETAAYAAIDRDLDRSEQ